MQTWNIRPSHPPAGRVALCGLDLVAGYRYFDGIRFFDSRLDLQRLQDALKKTIDHYPLLAGQLVEEAGRLYIDFEGPGVTFAVDEVGGACPAYGPGIPQVNVQRLFLPKPMGPPQPNDKRQPIGKPLLLLKVTRFSDGRFAIAGASCHVLGDATAMGRLFEDWYAFYKGATSIEPPEFSREPVIALGAAQADTPSVKSGLGVGEPTVQEMQDRYFEPQYESVSMAASQRAALESMLESARDSGITMNDVVHALLLKSHACAIPESQTQVAASLAYDFRRVRSFSVPRKYFGNAVLQRWLKLSRAETVAASCMELASRFMEFGRQDAESARQDIGFLQGEYRSGRVSRGGNLSHVKLPLGPGSIILNNLSLSLSGKFDFGGMELWSDFAITEPLPVRMAVVHDDHQGGFSVFLILPKEQVTAFKKAWAEGIDELIGGRHATRH
jgi:hypothetical protein